MSRKTHFSRRGTSLTSYPLSSPPPFSACSIEVIRSRFTTLLGQSFSGGTPPPPPLGIMGSFFSGRIQSIRIDPSPCSLSHEDPSRSLWRGSDFSVRNFTPLSFHECEHMKVSLFPLLAFFCLMGSALDSYFFVCRWSALGFQSSSLLSNENVIYLLTFSRSRD